ELADPPPGAQRFEKLVAGGYLGEIARRLLIDLAAGSGLFATWTRALHSPFGLDTAALGQIAGDRSPGLSEAGGVLRGLGVESTAGEREALRILAHLVVTRSARLIAAALLGTLEHIDPALDSRHHVAVDGSLYGRYPGYARLVEAGFAELCGAERAGRIRLEFAKDSTALGAAVIAAATADQRPGGG
ncbi:MAG TPA: hypothetical protein VEL75_07020, partial [Candidatus Methylomirabilis sp.]|nr:hypothetical protein [Candidatus Methylomirabilis sp.]